jgi:formylglycine-generating enzyme required for sulfatase activity
MADAGTGEKLKVFISYSRKDSAAFVDDLVVGLEDRGFAPILDRHDIKPGEPWEARLGGLIEQSDTVVFVVSPEAVKSERCGWEVDKTVALSKRLLPVIYKSVPDAQIPFKVRERQFIRFDTGPGVMRPLRELSDALRVDLQWIREHTRLGELATRWDGRGRPKSLLLRGYEIDAAKTWMAARNAAAPEITDVQCAFVKASEEAETTWLGKERQLIREARRIAWLLGSLAMLIGTAWISQSFIIKEWNWYWNVRPYQRANFDPYVLKPETERTLLRGKAFRECAKDCPEMVVIPAGTFLMGASPGDTDQYPSEMPRHQVSIAKPFAVSKFEVRLADWNACVSVGGCQEITSFFNDEKDWPVTYVSWEDAQMYVRWFSRMTGKVYRLLSEAEWEYAARAGTQGLYSWGDEIGKNKANCDGCGSVWDNKSPAKVGSFEANAFGLFDMAGNVWEWVEDCVHEDYDQAPKDGSAWTEPNCRRRVIRGGSYTNPPKFLRAANRGDTTSPSTLSKNIGFRIARTINP